MAVPDDFADRVLDLVEQIPVGRVVSYGDIAEMLGAGGPRLVARVLSRGAEGAPWHRVLRADGSAAPEVAPVQIRRLRDEGVPFRSAPGDRVDMSQARWEGPAGG